MEYQTLLQFSGTVLVLALTPGQDMALILGRAIGEGRGVALLTVLGFALAGLVQVPLAAFGLAAIVQSSPLLFHLIKIIGAAYILYMGVKLLRPVDRTVVTTSTGTTSISALRDGFIASLLNPKALLFILAFLPQFVDKSDGSATVQMLTLVVVMKSIVLVVEAAIALVAASISGLFGRNGGLIRGQQYISAVTLIALGIWMLLDGYSSL